MDVEKYKDWLRDKVREAATEAVEKECEYHEGRESGFFEAYAELCRQIGGRV